MMKASLNGMKKISKANIELMTESIYDCLVLIKEIENVYQINEENDKIKELKKIEQFFNDTLLQLVTIRKKYYKT